MSAIYSRVDSQLRCALPLVLLGLSTLAHTAHAQSPSSGNDERSETNRTVSTLSFLGGATAGLLAHEGGHLFFDVVFDADPGVRRVEFAGIPFFALTHREGLSPRREYTIDAAGFWVQNALSEWVLTRRPGLHRERAPFAKGLLAWSLSSSAAYAAASFGTFGPPQRDTRGMAESLGIREPWVGAMLLVPAVCDLWRYFDPDNRWPRWISRVGKLSLVLVVVRARE
jgi:hypothetical protein